MMYPTDVVMRQIRQEMEREVARYNLIKLAREGQPTLWQRLHARLSIAQSRTAPQEQQPALCQDVVVLSH